MSVNVSKFGSKVSTQKEGAQKLLEILSQKA